MSRPSVSNILSKLQQMDSYDFENFIADIWKQQDWDTQVTKKSNDQGIDVIATKSFPYDKIALIQAKKYGPGSKVSSPEIQQYASLRQQQKNIDEIVIVTSSGFTSQAEELAENLNVKCITGTKLAELVVNTEMYTLIDDYMTGAAPNDSVEIEPQQKQLNESVIDRDAKQDRENSINFTAEGRYLLIELIGLADIHAIGADFTYSKDLRGTVASFEIYNKTSRMWRWKDEYIQFVDVHGYSHSPKHEIYDRDLPSSWKADRAIIDSHTKIRCIVYIDSLNPAILDKVIFDQPVHQSYRSGFQYGENEDTSNIMKQLRESERIELYIDSNSARNLRTFPEPVCNFIM